MLTLRCDFSDKLLNLALFLMGLTSTFMILQFYNHGIVWFLGTLSATVIIITKRKINVKIFDVPFFLFLISLLLTVRFAVVSVVSTAMLFLIALQLQSCHKKEFHIFIQGVKVSCLFNICWCILQFILFKFINFNINDFLFIDTFHMVEKASFDKYLTGMAWHPINLAPVLLLSVLFFDNWIVWGMCFFIAVNASSSTTILALVMAFFLLRMKDIKLTYKLKKSLPVHQSMIIIIGAFILVIALYFLFPVILDELQRLLNRVSGSTDRSTYLHKRYYTSVFYVFANSKPYDILFGCGYHQSGLVFSRLFNQFTRLTSWSVESDPMDYLYGNGIIGFSLFYTFLIGNLIRSWFSDYKLFCFYAVIIVCGIAYNCQFEWVMMLELIFEVMRKKGINVFEKSKHNKWHLFDSYKDFANVIYDID